MKSECEGTGNCFSARHSANESAPGAGSVDGGSPAGKESAIVLSSIFSRISNASCFLALQANWRRARINPGKYLHLSQRYEHTIVAQHSGRQH
jgi:hypothetical protein